MKKTALIGICIAATMLSGCQSTFKFLGVDDTENVDVSTNSDVYALVGETDVLNDRAVNFNKRVSHIVTFEFDSNKLPFNAAEVIEPHVRFLVANPNYKVALQGNASNEGTRGYNYELAKERVTSVKDLFVNLGIEPEQVVELSVGETQSEFVPQRSVIISY